MHTVGWHVNDGLRNRAANDKHQVYPCAAVFACELPKTTAVTRVDSLS